jgi:chromosome segregation ATPase
MNSEIELAKDQLWKFQLRREHAQLLKDMDSHKEAFTAFAEEARVAQEGLKEQLTGLKSRFEKLADDSKKQAQEAKDHRRAIDGKVAEIDRIKADLMALGVHVNTIEGKQSTLVERKCRIFHSFIC